MLKILDQIPMKKEQFYKNKSHHWLCLNAILLHVIILGVSQYTGFNHNHDI